MGLRVVWAPELAGRSLVWLAGVHPPASSARRPRAKLTWIIHLTSRSVNGNATLQCPIKEDKYSVVQSVDLPEEIPRGKFDLVR